MTVIKHYIMIDESCRAQSVDMCVHHEFYITSKSMNT